MLREKTLPRVSVGLPTYNRAITLKQTINSVLNQDYANIELIISDNASTDQTQAICEGFGCKDGRVKYIRQEYNRGPVANFREALNNSSGEFFMWLSDDDWLDSSYISECVKTLLKEKDLSLVAGKTIYYHSDNSSYEETIINHLQNSGVIRLLDYYVRLRSNSFFYGVMRRKDLENVRFPNTIGTDGLIMAVIVYLGKTRVLDNISIHRRLGGSSANFRKLASILKLPKLEVLFPVVGFAVHAFKDISFRVPIFSRLGKVRRHIIAIYVFFIIIFMKSVPLMFIESSKNVLKLCFGERRTKEIRSFLKKIIVRSV
ncbi:MAG: glycosyltransferase family 2 protein [Candidatus Omnitrophica bacterium]|nr:glycosyltransferase family 2 protein [Candidatus Omnitrophota bacterium]